MLSWHRICVIILTKIPEKGGRSRLGRSSPGRRRDKEACYGEVTTLDLVIIGLYLLFMLLVGVWFIKRIKNTDDCYVAGTHWGQWSWRHHVCHHYRRQRHDGAGRHRLHHGLHGHCHRPALYARAYLSSPATPGVFQQVGRSTTSSHPQPVQYRFGKPAKCVLAAAIGFRRQVGTVAADAATATIIKLLGGQVGISYEMGAFIATPSSSSIPRLRTVRRGVRRCGAVFPSHCFVYLIPFQSGLSGGSRELLGQPGQTITHRRQDTEGTSSPIWSSPWRGRVWQRALHDQG